MWELSSQELLFECNVDRSGTNRRRTFFNELYVNYRNKDMNLSIYLVVTSIIVVGLTVVCGHRRSLLPGKQSGAHLGSKEPGVQTISVVTVVDGGK